MHRCGCIGTSGPIRTAQIMCRLHFRVHKASHFLRRAVIETLDVQCVHVAIVMLQVIDDSIGNTLVAASTLTPEIREKLNGGGAGNKVRMYCAFSVARQARVCQHHSNEKMLFDGRMYCVGSC